VARHDLETVVDELLVFGEGGAFQDDVAAIDGVVEQGMLEVTLLTKLDSLQKKKPLARVACLFCIGQSIVLLRMWDGRDAKSIMTFH
jgi:hypothetical protein